MIDNVSQFIDSVARTDLAKAARRSATTIWNAHRAAFVTTRHEAGKVLVLAIDEGQKFAARVKPRTVKKATRRSTRRAA